MKSRKRKPINKSLRLFRNRGYAAVPVIKGVNMKKLASILLALAMLLSLSATASAGDLPPDTNEVSFDGVTVTATGYSFAPGADGAPRLTIFLRAENLGEGVKTLRCAAFQIVSCELPACLCLTLDPGESAEEALVVPLAALSFFDLSDTLRDFIRLRFSAVGTEGEPAFSDWLYLRLGAAPELTGQESEDVEFFARFGARIRPLGASCDGRYLTAWLLLENNNDFALRLTGSKAEDETAHYSLNGGYVQAYSRAAFRIDMPLEKTPMAVSFALRCNLSGYADGENNPPVNMTGLRLPLRLEAAEDGRWTISLSDEAETNFDQSYIARVGMRSFSYSECLPLWVVNPEQKPLPEREAELASLVCCAGYEVLAGAEQLIERGGVRLTALPLVLRSFTGEALALTLRPVADAVWLPCLTGGKLTAAACGGAGMTCLFDAGGLAYTEYAGEAELNCGLALCVGPAANPARIYGRHPTARHSKAAADLKPKEPCAFEETELDGLSVRLLGMDLEDGLSLWLQVRNDTDADLPFADARLQAMLNSSVLDLINSGAAVPAQSECLVLLRGAVFQEDGAADPFAFKLPPLSELNTFKLRLGPEEDAETMTLMFQRNGAVMFASVG